MVECMSKEVTEKLKTILENSEGTTIKGDDVVAPNFPCKETVTIGELQEIAQKRVRPESQSNIEFDKVISIDDLFGCGQVCAISCDTEDKAKLLLEVFNKMGKIWRNGQEYSKDKTYFERYGEFIAYSTNGAVDNIRKALIRNIPVYTFDEIDFSKYKKIDINPKCAYDNYKEMKMSDFLVPTNLKNLDAISEYSDRYRLAYVPGLLEHIREEDLDTNDLVYIQTSRELKGNPLNRSDYSSVDNEVKRKACWTRTPDGVDYVITRGKKIDKTYYFDEDLVEEPRIGFIPCAKLKGSLVVGARSLSSKHFRISDKGKYHTIEFGNYPTTRVSREIEDRLNEEYRNKNYTTLQETGEKYLSPFIKEKSDFSHNKVYLYNDKKYVRKVVDGYARWYNVTPLEWKISNWNDLPKEINPKGSGVSDDIEICCSGIINLLPFHYSSGDTWDNVAFWQNSTIRLYLNGYDDNQIKANGNSKYLSKRYAGDFTESNFLTEALSEKVKIPIYEMANYKITIDDFLNLKDHMLIKCDSEFKMQMLLKILYNIGVLDRNGAKFLKEQYKKYSSNTCITSDLGVCDFEKYKLNSKTKIFEFNEVDLSKHLTHEQVQTIQQNLGYNPIISYNELEK